MHACATAACARSRTCACGRKRPSSQHRRGHTSRAWGTKPSRKWRSRKERGGRYATPFTWHCAPTCAHRVAWHPAVMTHAHRCRVPRAQCTLGRVAGARGVCAAPRTRRATRAHVPFQDAARREGWARVRNACACPVLARTMPARARASRGACRPRCHRLKPTPTQQCHHGGRELLGRPPRTNRSPCLPNLPHDRPCVLARSCPRVAAGH